MKPTLVTLLILAFVAPAAAQHWPAFCGPDETGVAAATARPPVSFDATRPRNLAWRTPIPGLADSSPGGQEVSTVSRRFGSVYNQVFFPTVNCD